MKEKTTKIIVIASIVIYVLAIIILKAAESSMDFDVLFSLYRIVLFGIIPVVGFIGCLILSFTRAKLFPLFAAATAVVSYLLPIIIGMYSSESGGFVFVPIAFVIAVVPAIAGLVIGFVSGLVKNSLTGSRA